MMEKHLVKNQLRHPHVDETEGLGQGERLAYGGMPQVQLIRDWTHVSTSRLLYDLCMGTVTTGLRSRARKKVHNVHKQGYFVTKG
jgi:hypothetical protein